MGGAGVETGCNGQGAGQTGPSGFPMLSSTPGWRPGSRSNTQAEGLSCPSWLPPGSNTQAAGLSWPSPLPPSPRSSSTFKCSRLVTRRACGVSTKAAHHANGW